MQEIDIIGMLSDRLPEIGAAALFAGGSAIVTAFWKGVIVRGRVRRRIAVEIVSIQRQLYERANPSTGWSGNGLRDSWMLDPFLRHINLLKDLAEQENLSDQVKTALEKYYLKASAFVEAWSTAKARHRNNFWMFYDAALEAGRDALKRLRRERVHREDIAELQGKARPEDADSAASRQLDAGFDPANPSAQSEPPSGRLLN